MSEILLTEQASSSVTPTAGRVVIYAKTDGYLYFKNDTGVETRVNPQTVATAAEWTAANPVLAAGVFGVESDTMKFKIGDGATAWNSLAYWRYTAEHITIPTTGGTTVLTVPQSRASSMAVSGTLVSNAIIVTPDTMALFVAENITTGAFTVTFKTAAGTGVVVPQGSHVTLYADGVNIENPVTAGAGSGDVVGPASAANNNFASYDGITGKIIKDSGSSASSFEPANANIQSHIASTSNPHSVTKSQVGLGNCDNTSDVNKPVSTAQAAADTAAENNAKAYADTLVLGLLDDRGNYDASVNTFPASGGSGTAGAIMKGDMWRISVAGTLGGEAVAIGDAVRALSDAPGQTASNWAVMFDSATTAAEITCTTHNVGNSTNLDTFLANLDASQTAQKDSGFESWSGAGNYYSVAASQLTLLRGGVGYIKGKKITWNAPQTTGTLAANSGHWVYIDTNGTIGSATSRTETLYQDNIILFEAHNDGTDLEVVVENHACSFDTDSGHLLHDVIGTVLTPVSGTNVIGVDVTRVATGTGGAAGDRQIKIVGTADVNDQGLVTNIPDSAGAAISWKIYYKNALGNWTEYATQTQVPMFYNNAGTPTALATSGSTDTGVFVAYAVKAEPNSGLPIYILVMDDAVYATDATALSAIADGTVSIADGTLFQALEPVRLGYVVVTNNVSGGYISTLQVSKQVGASSVGGGAGASSASSIPTNTADFKGTLSVTDSNVQTALNTVDKIERISADLVAAGTTDLSTMTGNFGRVTGNTGITDFGVHAAGHLVHLVFTGAPLITHSATLDIPGAANLQIAAGDRMILRALGDGTFAAGTSGNYWQIITHIPASVTGTGSAVKNTNPTLTNPTLNAGSGVLVLPQSASPVQTAEGSMVWDTDDNLLTVGDGASRKTMVDTDTAQTLSSKTLVTPALGTAASGDLRNCSLAVAPAIGGTTPAAGAFTTLSATGNVTLGDASTDTVQINGYAAIGTTPDARQLFQIAGISTGGVTGHGLLCAPTFSTAVTTAARSGYFSVSTTASAYTLASAYGCYIANATKGAGSTITDLFGLHIADQTPGTNNYGISNAVSSGANKWGYYGGGTANNAFAGATRFGGVTAPVATVDVAGNIAATTSILSSGATSGIGYTTGAGGTVAQGAGSGKATGVTLAKVCGTITMDGASLAADTTVTFVLTMTGFTLNATDQMVLSHISVGTFGAYVLNARYASATTMNVDVHNCTPGALAEAIVLQYSLIRSVAA